MVGLDHAEISISLGGDPKSKTMVEERNFVSLLLRRLLRLDEGEKGGKVSPKGCSLIHKMDSWVWFIMRR